MSVYGVWVISSCVTIPHCVDMSVYGASRVGWVPLLQGAFSQTEKCIHCEKVRQKIATKTTPAEKGVCFIKPILGIFTVPGSPRVNRPQILTWGLPDPHPPPYLRRWLYQSPPLPLRTDPTTNAVDNQGPALAGSALAATCLGRSKVCSAFWFLACFSSVQSHVFRSLIGVRTLEMPVPYPPPKEGVYTRTSSHQPLLFGRRGTDHLPWVG